MPLLLLAISVVGQESKAIQKLRLLEEEGKFLKLEFKCYNLSNDDQVRREPLLYLYWSKACYEISKMDDQAEDYPKAYKDAVKYATKYVTKDKKNLYQDEGAEYVAMIQDETLNTAKTFYSEGEFKKARSNYKILTKLNKEDHTAWFMKSVCELRLRLVGDARVSFEKAWGLEGARDQVEKLNAEDRELLKENFMTYFEGTDGEGSNSRP